MAEEVESFEVEHRKLPKELVKKLRLGKNLKNGLVSWKVADKLALITNALHNEANDDRDNKELLAFSLDFQHRVRRIISSNGKDKARRKLGYGL